MTTMAKGSVKRKAGPVSEETASKKSRSSTYHHDLDNEGSVYSEVESAGESDDDYGSKTADTPITPFSPSRTMYPSQYKTIPCTYSGCTKKFNRPARLASHLRSHTNERPFKCTYEDCDKAYTESKHLTQHVKGTHLQERSYKCDWQNCDKTFLTGTRLRRHKEAHQGHERFKCTGYPPCDQAFRKHQTLQRHVRAEHEGLTPFPCTHVDPQTGIRCHVGFDTGGSLRKHEDRIHGALRFFCDECKTFSITADGAPQPLGFRTKTELNKHMKTVHLNCLFCDLLFRSQEDLLRHVEDAHSEIPPPLESTRTESKISCPTTGCGKTFAKKYNLDVHIRTVHDGERFKCGEYDLSLSALAEGWDGTDACGKEFAAKVNLEDHVRTQHMGLRSVVNANRYKSAGSSKHAVKVEPTLDPVALLTGSAYAEQPGRDIACTVDGCPWRFTREYDMEQHIRKKHHKAEDLDDDIEAASAAAFASLYANEHLMLADPPFSVGTNNLDGILDGSPRNNFDWEVPEPGSEDTFWFGADDGSGNFGSGFRSRDEWSNEQMEMRRLIDENNSVELNFEHLVDPALASI